MVVSDIRILIVDDRVFVRDALGLFLENQPHFQLVGQASSGEDAIEQCRVLNPDVVLIDIVMPGIGGVAAIQQIRRQYPDIRVIALTSHETEISREEILEAGADDFLIKDTTGDTLANAIRAVNRK